MSTPLARFDGSHHQPCVTIWFGYEQTHPVTGAPLREWVKDLPERRWLAQERAWAITATGPDPDRVLAEAGFTVIGPDDLECSLADYASPLIEPDKQYAMTSVRPRLAGREHTETSLPVPTAAVWRGSEGRWLLPTAASVSPSRRVLGDGTLAGLDAVPVTELASCDAATVEAMETAGIASLSGLLHTVPLRYLDRSDPQSVAGSERGQTIAFIGVVDKVKPGARPASPTTVTVHDADGTRVSCRWFRARWVSRRFRSGMGVLVHGAVETFTTRSGSTGYGMTNPIMDELAADADDAATPVIPIYPQSAKAGLSTWQILRACREALGRVGDLTDPIPGATLAARGLVSRRDAVRNVHLPPDLPAATTARERIAYDELLRLQLVVATARAETASSRAVAHARVSGGACEAYLASLPFPLTGAQSRALEQVRTDMAATTPMNRLLQGDVGSGKTPVSVAAMLTAIDSGRQSAMIAPTEVLATQHHRDILASVRGLTRADGTPVVLALLTHKNVGLSTDPPGSPSSRKQVMAAIRDGSAHVVVGTHAVFSEKTTFASLSMVVVDEQHRFGVEQRRAAAGKAADVTPDFLQATATPIPRTAVMTTFGDLDVSTIDEMPPGRVPADTAWLRGDPARTDYLADKDSKAWATARQQLAQGRQVFVVVPAVESATKEAATAHATATALGAGAFSDYRVGCVTGKDKPDQRTQTMAAFTAGDVDVLVATTVIEVGVNVPNASVIVILGAERFGLAQLHQLRGRVGRGRWPGHCLLLSPGATATARARLEAMVATTDGFVLAEEDLRIRGTGHLTGSAQAGTSNDLIVADVLADEELLAWARTDATAIIDTDPHLANHPGLRAELEAALDEDARGWLLSA